MSLFSCAVQQGSHSASMCGCTYRYTKAKGSGKGQQKALERDIVMSIHSQNRISQPLKGDSGQSDPIKVCVSFTLQFEEFPLHPSSAHWSSILRDKIESAAREAFRCGFSSGYAGLTRGASSTPPPPAAHSSLGIRNTIKFS